ncbi:hypothetical protein NDU88_002121 [Pleurodeles waltl]|uniref:Uncharacterized protein n=1 Tax=Pleurodeles waltl TaxID=8319 RepID=A0AAV7UCA8_PLEWA|nr:hypothetical protein NDU88_002121 [Pleurodeles waltl]
MNGSPAGPSRREPYGRSPVWSTRGVHEPPEAVFSFSIFSLLRCRACLLLCRREAGGEKRTIVDKLIDLLVEEKGDPRMANLILTGDFNLNLLQDANMDNDKELHILPTLAIN